MDDSRIDQLMDEGWKRLSSTLDKELPRKRKRRFVPLWWIMAGLLFISFSTFMYQKSVHKVHNDSIPKYHKPLKNDDLIANGKVANSPKAANLKVDKNKGTEQQTHVFVTNNKVNDNEAIVKNPKAAKILEFNNFMKYNDENKILNSASKDGHRHYSSDVGELVGNSNVNNEIASDAKENNDGTSFQLSQNRIKTDVVLSKIKLNSHFPLLSQRQWLPSIQPTKLDNKRKHISFGLKSSFAFSDFGSPDYLKFGGFAQYRLNKKWFVDLGVGYQRYSDYQVIHHNAKKVNNIVYRDIQTSSGAFNGLVLQSAYVVGSKTLTINQLDVVDESILSTSINALHYANVELNAGYRLNKLLSGIVGINLSKRVVANYSVNDINTTLYEKYNQSKPSVTILKNGNQLLRNWIFSSSAGLQYDLPKGFALRSSLIYTPITYKSALIEIASQDKSSSVSLDANANLSQINITPKSGKLSFELGLLWNLK